jgi:hypothetical protein
MKDESNCQMLELTVSELESELLPRLKKEVFHVTSLAAFQLIQGEGTIRANANGKLGNNWPRSVSSYGRKLGAVCLFDLREASEEQIQNGLSCLYFLAPLELGETVVFLILSHDAHPKIFAWNDPRHDAHALLQSVPYLECWHVGDMPLSIVDRTIRVQVKRPAVLPGSSTATCATALKHLWASECRYEPTRDDFQ